MAINDSVVTQGAVKQGRSAGTGIGTRKHWSTCVLPGLDNEVIVHQRAQGIHWQAVLKDGVDLISLYLRTGEGASETNMDICEDVGCKLASMGRAFIIGGDWNMEADELEST
eukprot:2359680-Karenia_brevis.AAC.1